MTHVPGWTFFQGLDSPGGDNTKDGKQIHGVGHLKGNLKAMCAAAAANPNVVAFNTNGWLKGVLLPRDKWSKWSKNPNEGLYVRDDQLSDQKAPAAPAPAAAGAGAGPKSASVAGDAKGAFLEIPWSDLVLGQRLGAGSFKTVYRATYKGQHVAVALLHARWLSAEHVASFQHELRMLAHLKGHPNCVQLLGACTAAPNFALVMELMERSAFEIVEKSHKLSLLAKLKVLYDIAAGLHHLRNQNVAHRDLKALNVLLSATNEKLPGGGTGVVAKLTDFGLSKLRAHSTPMHTAQIGTWNWMAPEVMMADDEKSYSWAADVYSCAMTFYEVMAEAIPFSGFSAAQLMRRVGMGDGSVRPILETRAGVPGAVVVLVKQMWAHKPEDRPTIQEVVESLARISTAFSIAPGPAATALNGVQQGVVWRVEPFVAPAAGVIRVASRLTGTVGHFHIIVFVNGVQKLHVELLHANVGGGNPQYPRARSSWDEDVIVDAGDLVTFQNGTNPGNSWTALIQFELAFHRS